MNSLNSYSFLNKSFLLRLFFTIFNQIYRDGCNKIVNVDCWYANRKRMMSSPGAVYIRKSGIGDGDRAVYLDFAFVIVQMGWRWSWRPAPFFSVPHELAPDKNLFLKKRVEEVQWQPLTLSLAGLPPRVDTFQPRLHKRRFERKLVFALYKTYTGTQLFLYCFSLSRKTSDPRLQLFENMAADEKTQTSSCELEMGYQTTVVSSILQYFYWC